MNILNFFEPNGLMYFLWEFIDSDSLQALIITCLQTYKFHNKAMNVVNVRIQFPCSILPLHLVSCPYNPLWFQQYARLNDMTHYHLLQLVEQSIDAYFYYGDDNTLNILDLFKEHDLLDYKVRIEYYEILKDEYEDERYYLRTNMFIRYGPTFINPLSGNLIYLGTQIPLYIDHRLFGFTEKTDKYHEVIRSIIYYNPDDRYRFRNNHAKSFHEFKFVNTM
jgi:hypothetical protein